MIRRTPGFKWWHGGLLGGAVLSVATGQKLLGEIPAMLAGSMPLGKFLVELPLFAAGIFALGFVCGVAGWAVWRILRSTGRLADVFVGIVVLNTFLMLCLWWFGGVTGDWRDVAFFGTFGTVGGAIVGFTTGGKMRQDIWEEQRRRDRAGRLSGRLSRTPSGSLRTRADAPPRQRGW